MDPSFFSLRIERTQFFYTRVRNQNQQLATFDVPRFFPFRNSGEGQGLLGQKSKNSHHSPQVGFEPTTSQLTADRSTTELLRNNGLKEAHSRSLDQLLTEQNESLFFTYTGRKGYDSKPLPGRRASRTRGRRSTIHSRDSYGSIDASCQFAK